jgi:ankyrin repeat protein
MSPLRKPLRRRALPFQLLLLASFAVAGCKSPVDCKALSNAAIEGEAARASELLSRGADVDCKDESANTALHWAAKMGHVEVARVLLDKGAKVNALNKEIETPLFLASQEGKVAVMAVLLERGANTNARCRDLGYTPLHAAVGRDEYAATALLIAKGANINAKTDYLEAPLHRAARHAFNGDGQIARALVEAGAALDPLDGRGSTPLIIAASEGNRAVAVLLVEHGADVNARNRLGRGALDYVETNPSLKKLLVAHGAQPAPSDGGAP